MTYLSKLLLVLLATAQAVSASAGDQQQIKVTFRSDGVPQTVQGRVVVRDQQGGLCLQDALGELWLVEGDELEASTELPLPFEPIARDALTEQLQKELGEGFQVYETTHYIVAYNTSREFARWLGSLLERLHRAFVNYWDRRGLDPHEPEFPLVVIVHADQASYRRASAAELGGGGDGVIGYYSLRTNRVSMFDLTGSEAVRAQRGDRTSLRDINRMLSQPAALPLVTTVVHEATHQVSFNVGLTARFADLPLWFVEGMAIYFEAPDLSSSRRWRGIGKVNYARLQTFRQQMGSWDQERLKQLLSGDQLFRQPATAAGAYADAWALTYYLIQHRPEEYRSYLAALAQKDPFVPDPPGRRLEEFQQHFGSLEPLLGDFLRSMSRVD